MPDDPLARETLVRGLVSTYAGDDPWTRYQEYQYVIAYADDHSDLGSQAIATQLDLPRGRVRSWLEGAKPDLVHGVEIADQHGWLDAAPGDRVFAGLVIAHAWVIAGGAITAETWVPTFAIGTDDPDNTLRTALTEVGVGIREYKRSNESRAPELRPHVDASVLGRFLAGALDAPIGSKAGADLTIPRWFDAVPHDTLFRWARTYVSLRGTPIDAGPDAYVLKCREEGRPDSWHRTLADWFGYLVGDPDQVIAGEQTLFFRQRAARVFNQPPTFPG